MLEGLKVLLLDVLIEDKAKRTLFYWPLGLWVLFTGLASAYELSRGTQVREWIWAILVPVTEVAPFFVKVGEAFGLLFCAVFFLHLILVIRWQKNHPSRTKQMEVHFRFLAAEALCMYTAVGLAGAFMVPYQPGLPMCFFQDTCTGGYLESSFLVLGMGQYLVVCIFVMVLALFLPRKKALPARKVRSSEH